MQGRTIRLIAWPAAILAAGVFVVQVWAAAPGAADPVPTLSPPPLPSVSILPSPSPSASPSPSGGTSGSGGANGSTGGGGAQGGTSTVSPGGTGSGASGAGNAVKAARAKATKTENAVTQRSEGTGCGTASAGLMRQLSSDQPVPTRVLSEPAAMDGPQSTSALMPILERAARHEHVSLRKTFLKVAGPFPVAGPASWSDDWHAFRPCPYPHLHEGLDIFAARGTPLVAITKGYVDEKGISSMSGLYVEITNRRGMQFFYDHLDAFARGLHKGEHVQQGQVLGYVGNTGDASGGPTHLHLEVQPDGIPTPPKPFVDRWLLKTLDRARLLVGSASPESERASTAVVAVTRPRLDDVVLIAAGASTETGDTLGIERSRSHTVAPSGDDMPLGIPLAGLGVLVGALVTGVAARRPPKRS